MFPKSSIPFLSFSTLAAAKLACASTILSYHATLTPELRTHSVTGTTEIDVRVMDEDREIVFPIHDLQIDTVRVGDKDVPVKVVDAELHVPLIGMPQKDHSSKISVNYHGAPKAGLEFGEDYVYSSWNPCNWMICREEPGEKARFSIDVIVPDGFQTQASGSYLGSSSVGPGIVKQSWQQTMPYSSYLFGFAAGHFSEVRQSTPKGNLVFLGVKDDQQTLTRKFAPSLQMLEFLRKKAGEPLPQANYTQLLVPGSEGQELSSYSVIGQEFLDPILDNPQEDWVIVHEMAHQWWGNSLTCKTWSDFWLNEGITSFMVAAYKQKKWGEAAYQQELGLFKKRYQAAIDKDFDKPLTWSGEYPSLGIKRAIVYYKGALFMDALRHEVGDRIFWDGLRRYTRANLGRSVISADFQKAMEYSARRSLKEIFNKWVY